MDDVRLMPHGGLPSGAVDYGSCFDKKGPWEVVCHQNVLGLPVAFHILCSAMARLLFLLALVLASVEALLPRASFLHPRSVQSSTQTFLSTSDFKTVNMLPELLLGFL